MESAGEESHTIQCLLLTSRLLTPTPPPLPPHARKRPRRPSTRLCFKLCFRLTAQLRFQLRCRLTARRAHPPRRRSHGAVQQRASTGLMAATFAPALTARSRIAPGSRVPPKTMPTVLFPVKTRLMHRKLRLLNLKQCPIRTIRNMWSRMGLT